MPITSLEINIIFFRRRNLKLNHYDAKHDEKVPTAKHLKLVPNNGMI